MGSEMCIRDRSETIYQLKTNHVGIQLVKSSDLENPRPQVTRQALSIAKKGEEVTANDSYHRSRLHRPKTQNESELEETSEFSENSSSGSKHEICVSKRARGGGLSFVLK